MSISLFNTPGTPLKRQRVNWNDRVHNPIGRVDDDAGWGETRRASANSPASALPSPNSPKHNHLLASLPDDDYARLQPNLALVPMPPRWPIYECGGHMSDVYFPTTSIVSQLYVMENGSSAEIAVTGNEGLVGISLFMGSETASSRAVVQSAGHAYRLKGAIFKREFARGGALQKLSLRFTRALLTQTAQTAVCNRHHVIDQQLCRWLLIRLDRLPGRELMVTQELIANMLGVRREGVTESAGRLQADGLIHCRRGHITVLARPMIEQRVCECYGVVKREFDRLLPQKASRVDQPAGGELRHSPHVRY